jgi:hypothetical protein
VINTIVCDVTALSRPSEEVAVGLGSVARFQKYGDSPVGRVWRMRWRENGCASSSERLWFGRKGIQRRRIETSASASAIHRLICCSTLLFLSLQMRHLANFFFRYN